MHFYKKISESWKQQKSLLCVGLDPDPFRISEFVKQKKDALFIFNREIIDATAEYVCAFKPQIAYYAAVGAENQLEKSIDYIKTKYPNISIILDAKRGDISSTAKLYAMEAFDRYQADAVTVNPYMGGDTLQPFLDYQDKGVFVLCRTSNPGSGDIQMLQDSGSPIYQHVAKKAVSEWNKNRNIGLVVGATYADEIAEVRKIVNDVPLLVPGVGTQGGDISVVLKNGLTEGKAGLIINVSRTILYAGKDENFSTAAAKAAQNISRQINQDRQLL